jgi:competence protein ComEC
VPAALRTGLACTHPVPTGLGALALAAFAGTLCGLFERLPAIALVALVGASAGRLVAGRRATPRPGRPWPTLLAVFGAAGLWGADAGRAAREPTPLERAVLEDGHPDAPPREIAGRLRRDGSLSPYGVTLRLLADPPATGPAGPAEVTLSVQGELARARLDDWRAGRRVRLTAVLRPARVYRNPGARGAWERLTRDAHVVGSVKSGRLVEVVARGSTLAELFGAVRAWTRIVVDRHVTPRDATSGAIVKAILIGDRAGLDDETTRRLQRAGVFHVIAISGGNIAVLTALLLGAGRLAGAPRAARLAATGLALVAYAEITGREPSVVRATVMALAWLVAAALDVAATPLTLLATTALVMLAIDPRSAVDAGAWLTFGATFGILVWSGHGRRWLARVSSRPSGAPLLSGATVVMNIACATLAAELVIWPLTAWTFALVTLVGPVANLMAVPTMSLVQLGGLLLLATAPISATAADTVAVAVDWCCRALVASATLAERWPMLVAAVAPPPGWLVAGYLAGLVVTVGAAGRRRLAAGYGLAGLCGALIVAHAASPLPTSGREALLRVVFLDVGQGDAALVQAPSGATILVDAGGLPGSTFDMGGRVVAPALWHLGVRRLTYALLTHPDPDHAGGLAALVPMFRPTEAWEGVPVGGHPVRERIRDAAFRSGAAWRELGRDDRVELGGVSVRVHHPPRPDWERVAARNDDSVVLELRYGSVSIVLTGDIGAEAERALAGRLAPVPLRVLKVPHHGSRTSSTAAWIAELSPAVAVVSAGRGNRFGHPAAEVLARYEAAGVAMFRTDLDGAVTVTTDGERLRVESVSGRSWRALEPPARVAALRADARRP